MNSDTTSETLPPQKLDDWLLDLLECPGCEYHRPLKLNAEGTSLDCDCGKFGFPVRDGIPILLVEEAVILDPSADPSDRKGANA